jgi:hypothetical protein
MLRGNSLLFFANFAMVKRPTSSLFAHLPVELVNIIFTFAAESRHTCLDLCLVSSWARHIALPHLFRTLVAKDDGPKFVTYFEDPSYVPFGTNINPASLVKNVWMPLEDYVGFPIVIIFENCPNITHMALTVSCFFMAICLTTPGYIVTPGLLGLSKVPGTGRDLHLTILGATSFRWVMRQYWNPQVSSRSSLFDQITHIRVETIISFKRWEHYGLRHFSRLSHLSLPYYDSMQHDPNHLDTFLKLQSLQMLVIAGVQKPSQRGHWKRLEAWVRSRRKMNKMVFFVEIPAVDIQVEWEEEMSGGESIWDRAVRYTTQWEARENATATLEMQATGGPVRRSRRRIVA